MKLPDSDTLDLSSLAGRNFRALRDTLDTYQPTVRVEQVGTITFVGHGVVRVEGMRGARADEVIQFQDGTRALIMNVAETEVGAVLLDENHELGAGDEAYRTEQILSVPVGGDLIGRVVDPLGRPLDQDRRIRAANYWPVERDAPAIMDRAPVTVPLQTGLKVVDALVPIGRGQRELILGDRHTGKTAITIDTVINQRDKDVICIYCAIGKRSADVARTIETLREHGAMDYSMVVVATEQAPPGLQFAAPYAATSMAEYFVADGRDVLVIYDDLTRHARAYRELSLLLERPPGREAYPGDIFYIHSRLLERSTHLKDELGGGSLTALPIVETEAQNISAYIPTNLISITDGQLYLSPDFFQEGVLPAVDVGNSVSRVGGKTQLPAYRIVSGDLKLSYAQFQELEAFARFDTRLDEETRHTLEHGRRVREILKQDQYQPMPVADQVIVLAVVSKGVLDNVPLDDILQTADAILEKVRAQHPKLMDRITAGEKLSPDDLALITDTARAHLESESGSHGNA